MKRGSTLLRTIAGFAVVLSAAAIAHGGQTPVLVQPADRRAVATAAFDVASIKRVAPDDAGAPLRVIPGALMPGGRWVASNATLLQILRSAFPEYARPGRIAGGPDWIDTELFQIDARTSANASDGEVRAMVERLLRERFSLRSHVEAQPRGVYALLVSNPALGAGLTRSARPCEEIRKANDPPAASADRCTEAWSETPGGLRRVQMPDFSMDALAALLSDAVDRPIVNRTGLTGFFDVRLEYLAQLAAQGDTSGPSVFAAVQEQLGLRLESRREPLDVLVIDAVSLPTPD